MVHCHCVHMEEIGGPQKSNLLFFFNWSHPPSKLTDFFPHAHQWTERNEFSKHSMTDISTNPISSNVICVLICHAMLWKFIPLCPTSLFLLPKILEKLTHTYSYSGGWGRLEDAKTWLTIPRITTRKQSFSLQERELYLGWLLVPQSPFWLGLRKNPWFRLFDFSCFSPLYWTVLILCHFEQSFCHKKGNSIACYLRIWNLTTKTLKEKQNTVHIHLFSWQALDCTGRRKLAQD